MKRIYTILAVLALAAIAFLTGRCSAEGRLADTPVVTRTDTLTIRDTLREPYPVVVDVVISDESIDVPLADIVIRNDSLVVLPMETKTYEGENYRAQVSGFRPNLDWVEVFPETRYVRETMTDNRKNMLYLSGEVLYSDRFAAAAMLTYQRRYKYFHLDAGIGYDIVGNNAVVMARMKIPLCRW